ncbi:S41 family peptidase [Maribacter chungangensis]|uniref:S41 family peptidase n=1 Tax=Maribacter chungangensis TaxID=1069117 RepID=A0ABW3B5Q5_9FLAO
MNKLILLFSIATFFFCCQSQTKKSIGKALIEYSYNDIDSAIIHYKKLKKENTKAYNFDDENELNNLGYKLLGENRVNDAIEIFKLLVNEFPNSANPYDSLGEAYLLNDNEELAIKNYKKSYELDPKNENADRIIVGFENNNRDRNKFLKIYSKKEYLEDIDELAKKLTTANPHPYKFMSKKDFWNVVKEKKELVTNKTTYSEFIWHCSELVANINCVHSGLGYFNQEREMLPKELFFPLEGRLIDDKFFITNPLINENLKKGSEILTINGVKFKDLKEEIFKHISSQGHIETTKTIFFNSYMNSYIPYALNFPKNYTITINGEKNPIRLEQLKTYNYPPRHYPTNLCDSKDLCLDIVNDDTAVLTIINTGDYYGSRFSIYKDFLDKSFQEIHSKEIKNLIIDMRSNGGGPGNTGIYLLRYLVKDAFIYKKLSEGANIANKSFEPLENRYKGATYFLVDGESGSTIPHILSHIKEKKLATIIGEEMGGNHFCTGGQRHYKLSNTSVFYLVGRYTNVSAADSFPDNRGIMPDYFVTQDIHDYLNDVDTVMKYTLELIQKEKQ